LHGQRVAVLTHYAGGKNILSVDPEYAALSVSRRPLLTLTQQVKPGYLDQPLISSQRLPPLLSNLLPEGALREWMVASLKVHSADEFPLLAWTGRDLPGAIVATPVAMGEIPAWALSDRDQVDPVQIEVRNAAGRFSLAGVQMKFSSNRRDGRFTVGSTVGDDDWIIKTPSTVHRNVPENEYTSMRLAQAMGVEIPAIELVSRDALVNLPDIPLPPESLAYAIRRFDRSPQGRVHSEDFAQIFDLYAHEKYGRRNYEQIAAALYRYGAAGLEDVQQMARRLLANILLANGDAHLKNWTLFYPDAVSPRLAPAYDIVSTLAYVNGERGLALNLGRQKAWVGMDLGTFSIWAERNGVSWPAVRVHLLDALAAARDTWPVLLSELPMLDAHKSVLEAHWRSLSADFRVA
jgi:serine/threonine-protein kinase HipA